jgi:DNA-binding response OmpR family regulator
MNHRKVLETFRQRGSRNSPAFARDECNVKRILVIDDDPEVQQAVRRTLEPAGYDIITVAHGGIAMDTFRATMPRLVILDLRLPGKSGQDLCREIRNESANIPILVLSAVSEERERVLLLALGADDYMTKPFSPRELVTRVDAVIRRSNEGVAQMKD